MGCRRTAHFAQYNNSIVFIFPITIRYQLREWLKYESYIMYSILPLLLLNLIISLSFFLILMFCPFFSLVAFPEK